MVSVRVMQMTVHEVVDMIAMGDRLMTAPRAVNVSRVVSYAAEGWRAGIGVGVGDADHVLLHLGAFGVVEVAIVDVVHMTFVKYRGVAAVGPMLVVVMRVHVVGLGDVWHGNSFRRRDRLRLAAGAADAVTREVDAAPFTQPGPLPCKAPAARGREDSASLHGPSPNDP